MLCGQHGGAVVSASASQQEGCGLGSGLALKSSVLELGRDFANKHTYFMTIVHIKQWI